MGKGANIQGINRRKDLRHWIPAFAGMTKEMGVPQFHGFFFPLP